MNSVFMITPKPDETPLNTVGCLLIPCLHHCNTTHTGILEVEEQQQVLLYFTIIFTTAD